MITSDFSRTYFQINRNLNANPDFRIQSRYGETLEYIDYQTKITDPLKRLVGGYGRRINPFFLIAEALWIWKGQVDVKFLANFNKKIVEFSDDGTVFHAPYGYRLRESQFGDQFKTFCLQAQKDLESRRHVMSIWNPSLDLNVDSKDIPCNDMLMFKVRNGGLYQTIQNRSNDLHWGLSTNVFQFSFIGEMLSNILGVDYVQQTHNSQSLHVYLSHGDKKFGLNKELLKKTEDCKIKSLYDECMYKAIDFEPKGSTYASKLVHTDKMIYDILHSVKLIKSMLESGFIKQSLSILDLHKRIIHFEYGSKVFSFYFSVLALYLIYKHKLKYGSKVEAKFETVTSLIDSFYELWPNEDPRLYDVLRLATSFISKGIDTESEEFKKLYSGLNTAYPICLFTSTL